MRVALQRAAPCTQWAKENLTARDGWNPLRAVATQKRMTTMEIEHLFW